MIKEIKSDFYRYYNLYYLRQKSNPRKVIAALIHPGFRLCCYLRLLKSNLGNSIILRLFLSPILLILKIFLMPISKCDISPYTEIGPGLFLPHPIGVVIAPQSKIGENCNIFNDVVLGINHLSKDRHAPIIGDNVTIYAGVKIIGKVQICSNVVIGANSVVLHDIPANAIVAGVPAKILRYNSENCQLPF